MRPGISEKLPNAIGWDLPYLLQRNNRHGRRMEKRREEFPVDYDH